MASDAPARVRAHALRLLAAGVSSKVFPGAACAVVWRDVAGQVHRVEAAAGLLGPGPGREPKVDAQTPYDLGALTACVVGVAALRADARGAVDLDASVEKVLSHVRGGALGGVSVRQLFEHRAGLAAWGGLYFDVPHELGSPAARRWILGEAARRDGEHLEEGAASDLGLLVAGEALGRASRLGLAQVVEREVLAPLALQDELSYPAALPPERQAAYARRAAPTERCPWRGKLLRGEVQDENAAALGGVAGHAGLFGTARAVGAFGWALLEALEGRGAVLEAAALRPALTGAFGFAARAALEPACGRRLGEDAFGQVGLPGTSLVIDPSRSAALALLTNRICPSRANRKIDGFRPAFHDGVLAALDAG